MELVRTLSITHKYGLHLRASGKLAEVAKDFQSDVMLTCEGRSEEVDVKSVLELLGLGVEVGHSITLRVTGDDAEPAMNALVNLIEDDFGGI